MTAPPLPRYSLQSIFHMRDELYGIFKQTYVGLELDRETIDSLMMDIFTVLPGSVPKLAVFDTLTQHFDVKLTRPFLLELAWRIAGNIPSLKEGKPLHSWRAPGVLEWVPVQVVDMTPRRVPGKEAMQMARLKVLAGSLCTKILYKLWSHGSISVIGRTLGFTALRGGRHMSSPDEFANLRLYVLLDPSLSRDGQPGFYTVRCPAGCLEHNLAILKLRFRQGVKCPRGYVHDCYLCHVGYSDCPAGVHPESMVQGQCVVCGKSTWVLTGNTTAVCRTCRGK